MPVDISLLSAFLVGLLGGVHCVGMCSGIVGALSLGLPHTAPGKRGFLPYLLAYNLARILSYTIAGAALGGAAQFALSFSELQYAQRYLAIIAAIFMILLGLYLGGWWPILTRMERLGGTFWRHIEPLGRGLLPVRSPRHAFLLGLVWGWLPCGLVYSVLIWSLSTGSAVYGAALLFSFGLGTLPTLLTMGAMASRIACWVRNTWTRRLAGGLVLLFGIYSLIKVTHVTGI